MKINDLRVKALELLKENGLEDWNLEIRSFRGRIGSCHYESKTIKISREYTIENSEEIMIDVVLHEIGHALAGYGASHGNVWKAIVRSIGGTPTTYCEHVDLVTPKKKYVGECPSCHNEFYTNVRKKCACKLCCSLYNNGQFSEKYLMEYREG